MTPTPFLYKLLKLKESGKKVHIKFRVQIAQMTRNGPSMDFLALNGTISDVRENDGTFDIIGMNESAEPTIYTFVIADILTIMESLQDEKLA